MADQYLSKVLHLMHTEYGRRWTLAELAAAAGMSRSKLAARFKSRIGISPMEYFGRWRMEIARELLAAGERGMAEIAEIVGYESESADAELHHPGAEFCHPGVEFCHPGVEFCHPGVEFCHPGAEFCHPGAEFCHPGAEFCHPGVEFCHPGAEFCRPGAGGGSDRTER